MSNKVLLELVLSNLEAAKEKQKIADKKIDHHTKEFSVFKEEIKTEMSNLKNEIKEYRSFIGGVIWSFGGLLTVITLAVKYLKIKFGMGG